MSCLYLDKDKVIYDIKKAGKGIVSHFLVLKPKTLCFQRITEIIHKKSCLEPWRSSYRSTTKLLFLSIVRVIQTLIYTLNMDKIEIINYRQKCHLQCNNSWLTQILGQLFLWQHGVRRLNFCSFCQKVRTFPLIFPVKLKRYIIENSLVDLDHVHRTEKENVSLVCTLLNAMLFWNVRVLW